MDTRGGSWGNDPRESQERLNEGGEQTHHYYCPAGMGGVCSCPEEENLTNNNDYSSIKKSSKSAKRYCDGNPYDSPSFSSDSSSYSGCNGSSSCCQSPSSCPTSSGPYHQQQQPSRDSSCRYCQCNCCIECNMQQNKATYCDYYDPSKTYGSGSYAPPKIQVTAKILFGTVSAITNLKQKKSSKKC